MPYRIDIYDPPPDGLDVLVDLGALDIEALGSGLAAIMPDSVTKSTLIDALGVDAITISAATPRDNGSVWLLSLRALRIGCVLIASPELAAPTRALRLIDSHAFGTGHHPTTVLCMKALEEILSAECPDSVLDVGTGSGILALSALIMGVPQAIGLDIDLDALEIAAENARLNQLGDRLGLVLGAPDVVDGRWSLVVANLLAAPLIEMAPVLVRRVGKHGRLILSGISVSLASEVQQAYQHFGMRHIGSKTRGGWAVVMLQASW